MSARIGVAQYLFQQHATQTTEANKPDCLDLGHLRLQTLYTQTPTTGAATNKGDREDEVAIALEVLGGPVHEDTPGGVEVYGLGSWLLTWC